MSVVRKLSDGDMEKWDAFVETAESGTIYHTSSWLRLIRKAYRHEPVYLAVEDENGTIRGGLPAFIVGNGLGGGRISSLPGAQFCGPLVANQEDCDLLVDSLRKLTELYGVKYCEIKTRGGLLHGDRGMVRVEGCYSDYVLDIDRPLETVVASFNKSCVQRILKKIDDGGLRLRRAESVDDVRPFYRLYLKMRKTHGLLPQPRAFFSTMWEEMARDGRIEILFAEYRGRIISTSLYLAYKDTFYYESGASESGMLRLHPSHFITWAAIRRARERGFSKFDFGRTADSNKGLSDFKAHWGTTRVPLVYYYLPDIDDVARMRQGGMQKKMMNFVVRICPGPLCRLMGRALYRKLI